MASPIFPSLKTLAVFRHDVLQAKIKSVHIYELEGGVEDIVEREYVFYLVGAYQEVNTPDKVFAPVKNFAVSACKGGVTYGHWICLFCFNKKRIAQSESIPEILCIARNPKLASIPTLARDLDVIYQLKLSFEKTKSSENGESSKFVEGPSGRPQLLPLLESSKKRGFSKTVDSSQRIPQFLPPESSNNGQSSETVVGPSERSLSLPHFRSSKHGGISEGRRSSGGLSEDRGPSGSGGASEGRGASGTGGTSEGRGSSKTVEGPTGRPQTLPLFDLNSDPQILFHFDLNLPPPPDSDDEENEERPPGLIDKKQKRATTRDISKLTLDDLSKYFDLPIIEASKNLKVGLTVLKRKCREFGISRWPHRKIKSLDGLIHSLQEEVIWQLEEDKAAAMAVAKRQRMIESEKEKIEKKPSLDIQRETKKFRQDIFKRRHRARLLGSQSWNLSML